MIADFVARSLNVLGASLCMACAYVVFITGGGVWWFTWFLFLSVVNTMYATGVWSRPTKKNG